MVVPLEKITKVKMIMIEIGEANLYKIEFQNSLDKTEFIRILPSDLFPYFLQNVKQKKKEVRIKHWAHSLDFDI